MVQEIQSKLILKTNLRVQHYLTVATAGLLVKDIFNAI